MFGCRDKLEGASHQVSMAFGHDFNPSDREVRLNTLSRSYKRDEPVSIKEPAQVKSFQTKFLHGRRGTLRLGSFSSGSIGSGGG